METRSPKVGVGAYIIKGNKILFGRRQGAHGSSTWAPPGGHLEFGESIKTCAEREVYEETGLKVKYLKTIHATNDIFEKEDKHYITLAALCEYVSGEPKIMEPEKCEEWKWFEWNNLPAPLFLPVANLVKDGINPFKN